MLSDSSKGRESIQTHIVYDRISGRVFGRFRRYDVTQDEYCQCDPEEVLDLFRSDDKVLERVTDGDIHNLAVLTTALPSTVDLSNMQFSSTRQALVSKPRLQLRTDRDVLEGDGEDSITISIDVVDEQNCPQRDYQGEIQVTTTRGKLSARGGRVSIEQGHGSVTLTSVKETVDRVWVRACDQNNLAISDTLLLRFE